MKTIFFFLLILANTLCYSQEKLNKELKKQQIDTSKIHLINKDLLHQIIQSGDAEVYWVGIFVNYCKGTPSFLDNMTFFRNEYKSRLGVILCSSEKYKYAKSMLRVLSENSYTSFPVYMIDGDRYKEKGDSRYKGFEFRNDICEECRFTIIGVPYSIFFDKTGHIIKSGYLFKEDITNFLKTVLK